MKILNLTQHAATADQVAAGVVEPANKALVQKMITFDTLPEGQEVEYRARSLATIADGYKAAMIGGAPFFMGPLERALAAAGVKVLYAFSTRESRDEKLPDGSIKKTQVFRHTGFVEAVVPASTPFLGTSIGGVSKQRRFDEPDTRAAHARAKRILCRPQSAPPAQGARRVCRLSRTAREGTAPQTAATRRATGGCRCRSLYNYPNRAQTRRGRSRTGGTSTALSATRKNIPAKGKVPRRNSRTPFSHANHCGLIEFPGVDSPSIGRER